MPVDNQEEPFCLVDKNDKVIGTIPRKQANQDKSVIHRSVGVILTNNRDQILLQKRSKHKDLFPEYWTLSASGHVTYGQTYKQAAARELKEEIGISVPLRFVKKILVSQPTETEYSSVYLGKYSGDLLRLDRYEVSEVKWVHKSELPKYLKKLTPYAKHVLRSLELI